MKKINLNTQYQSGRMIMIFTEGTILKPKSWYTLYCHNSYIPIGDAVNKINSWEQQGAKIVYCTSRRKKQADDMAKLLKKHGFSGAFLVCRERGESYKKIVEELQPDILIEDDCKSIGGAWQMCITKVEPEIKAKIKSVVVSEFGGINQLPDDLKSLM